MFVSSVWEHAGAWVYGAGASTVSLLYPVVASAAGHSDVTALPWWASTTGLVVCLFIAFYKAWKDEHDQREAKNAELEKLSKPILKLELKRPVVSKQDSGAVTILFEAQIGNTGAESICDGYMLKVRLPSGRVIEPMIADVPEPGIRMMFDGAGHFTYPPSENIAQKTASEPIRKGSRVFGVLYYIIKGENPTEIASHQCEYEIECGDINEDRFVKKFSLSELAMFDPNQRTHGIKYIEHA